MKKVIFTIIALILVLTISKAQTAMQFTGKDCKGGSVNLFTDLDAGKVVILHFFMSNCGSCPPPAQKIQAMAKNINASHPGKVKGYAFPYENKTTCTYASTWVSSNSLSTLYTPMDSGAALVAYYGGFGMPTVVVLGGSDHKVLFSTMSFSTSDTTIMRDKILASLNASGINKSPVAKIAFNVFPSPANDNIAIDLNLKETSNLFIDIADFTGKQVSVIMNESQTGAVARQFSTSTLPIGIYFVRVQINGQTDVRKISIIH